MEHSSKGLYYSTWVERFSDEHTDRLMKKGQYQQLQEQKERKGVKMSEEKTQEEQGKELSTKEALSQKIAEANKPTPEQQEEIQRRVHRLERVIVKGDPYVRATYLIKAKSGDEETVLGKNDVMKIAEIWGQKVCDDEGLFKAVLVSEDKKYRAELVNVY